MITLYSTGCPNCKLLKEKLDRFGKKYETVTDTSIMKEKDIYAVPALEIDGEIYSFKEALKLVEVI